MGKPPSEHTLKVLEQARKNLPFSDKRGVRRSIRPGTRGSGLDEDLNDYEVGPVEIRGE